MRGSEEEGTEIVLQKLFVSNERAEMISKGFGWFKIYPDFVCL